MTVNQGLLEAGIDRDPFDSHAADGTCHLTGVARTTRMSDSRMCEREDVLSFGPLSLFAAERLLKKANEPIALGGRAIDILIALVEQAGEVVTQRELISRVWPDVTVEDANLRFHIAALRKALGDGRDGSRYVSNVVGRGYCFVAPVTRSSKRAVSASETTTTERVQKLPPRLLRMVGRVSTVLALEQQLEVGRFVSIAHPAAVRKRTVAIPPPPTLTPHSPTPPCSLH